MTLIKCFEENIMYLSSLSKVYRVLFVYINSIKLIADLFMNDATLERKKEVISTAIWDIR
jgi:hypothetical protein